MTIRRAIEYLRLLKPKVLSAMVTLYVLSYLASIGASGVSELPHPFLIGLAAISLAIGGSNALNCYLERDLDAVMLRTRGRPLPRGAISPRGALTLSMALLLIASFLSLLPASTAIYPLLLYLGGVSLYLLLYTLLLKRRSRLNALGVAPSAATPVLYGWMLGGAPFDLRPLFLGLIASLWTLPHLWSLAFVHAQDYRRGGVPMLTAVSPRKTAVRALLLSLLALIAFSLLLIPLSSSPIYPTSVISLNLLLSYLGLRFHLEPSGRRAWRLFKATSPYILLLFASYALDQALGNVIRMRIKL
jgi:protoheme IX farnesyltransferase